mgnify:FL=1
MQEFREILETDTVSDSREYINKGLQTLRSNFAGEAFPTENLAVGMKCYRIDKGRTYTLKSLDPPVWEEDGSAVKREDMTNSQLFTEAMTREALKNITDWSHFFSKLPVMEFLDLSPYPIDNATKLEYLFANDFMLKSVTGLEIGAGKEGAQGWISSSVKSFEGMFYRCESLLAFDGEVINTRGVENLKEMFAYCRRLTKLSVGHWLTQQCKTMAGMFKGCEKLSDIDASKWDVSNVEDFSLMFEDCSKLTGWFSWVNNNAVMHAGNLCTSEWATTKAKNMAGMFKGCVALKELDLSKFDMRNVENAQGMFQNCGSLSKIICGEHTFSTSKVRSFAYMFDTCSLQSFGKYVKEGSSPKWQEDMTVLGSLDFSSAVDMKAMLRNTGMYNVKCTWSREFLLDAYWGDFAEYDVWYKKYTVRGISLKINAPNAESIRQMFEAYNWHGIYLEMNTRNVRDMRWLFADCKASCIRLKGFDTTDLPESSGDNLGGGSGMANMFKGCHNLRFLIIDSTEFTFKLERQPRYQTRAVYTDILADLPAECRILVPKALLATYSEAPVWKNYEEKLAAIEDYEFDTGGNKMFVLYRRPTAQDTIRLQDTVAIRKV